MQSTSHVVESLLLFLCRHAFPDGFFFLKLGAGATVARHQNTALDSLYSILKAWFDCKDMPLPNTLLENISRKRILEKGAQEFNTSPKKGIAFLKDHGFLPDESPESLSKLLKSIPTIDKTLLGDYLSKKQNFEILQAFIKDFDFKNKRIDQALRLLLESFRLPGESQLIERVMEVFSREYYASLLQIRRSSAKMQPLFSRIQ